MTNCQLCGHEITFAQCGFASADGYRLCHHDTHSCFHRWTTYGERPKGTMRRFTLRRHKDITGISGTGDVAGGVEFKDGIVVVHWYGDDPSTVVWPSMGSVERIHGHNGNTEIVWHDQP